MHPAGAKRGAAQHTPRGEGTPRTVPSSKASSSAKTGTRPVQEGSNRRTTCESGREHHCAEAKQVTCSRSISRCPETAGKAGAQGEEAGQRRRVKGGGSKEAGPRRRVKEGGSKEAGLRRRV